MKSMNPVAMVIALRIAGNVTAAPTAIRLRVVQYVTAYPLGMVRVKSMKPVEMAIALLIVGNAKAALIVRPPRVGECAFPKSFLPYVSMVPVATVEKVAEVVRGALAVQL